MKSPKERFLSTEDARLHAELVVQPWFIRSLDAAMLSFVNSKTGTMNGTEAAVYQFQLSGARQFIELFENLSTKVNKPTPTNLDGLPHPSL